MQKIEKYLKNLNLNHINDMSDEQVISFFVNGYGGDTSRWNALTAKSAIKTKELNAKDVVKSMRKAIEKDVTFECCFIVNESGNGAEGLPQKHGWLLKPM